MRDTPIDGLIRKSLSAEVRNTSDSCVDENRMAAYLESRLSPKEIKTFEEHVSGCSVCQEILALAMKLRSDEADRLREGIRPSKKMLFRFSIPVPALGALLVCLVIGVVLYRIQHGPDQKIAELRFPEQEQVAQSLRPPEQSDAVESVPAALEQNAARKDTAVDQNRGRGQMAKTDKPTIVVQPPPAELASSPTSGGFHSAGVESPVELLEKKGVESAASASTGAVTQALSPEPEKTNAPSVVGNEVAAASPAASVSQPVAALPSGEASGAGSGVRQEKVSIEAANLLQAESADAIAPARTQEPFKRPRIYAAQNRIATTLYSTESLESSVRFAIKNLGSNLGSVESRSIGNKVFYKNLGYWIDKQCIGYQENQIVEIKSEDPDYVSIAKKYPEIRTILPAIIYWEKKIYLLR